MADYLQTQHLGLFMLNCSMNSLSGFTKFSFMRKNKTHDKNRRMRNNVDQKQAHPSYACDSCAFGGGDAQGYEGCASGNRHRCGSYNCPCPC